VSTSGALKIAGDWKGYYKQNKDKFHEYQKNYRNKIKIKTEAIKITEHQKWIKEQSKWLVNQKRLIEDELNQIEKQRSRLIC